MTQLIEPGITALAQPDGVAATLRSGSLLLTLSACCLLLGACGPAPHTSQNLSAAAPATAPPAQKTLESTLRLDEGADEMPFYPQIAQSRHGDTVAVWEQFDGEHYNIWGNSKRAHHGWGRASLLSASDTGHAYNPRVAVNANGQAVAVWVQMNGAVGSYAIWSSRLEPGSGWGTAMRVDTGGKSSKSSKGNSKGNSDGIRYAPDVAINDHGNAVAAWQQSDDRQVHVRANRFVAGVGWGQASRLEHGAGDLGAPQVAMDAGGNAMVVWPRFQLSRSELWGSGYALGAASRQSGSSGPSGTWDKALRIDTVPGYVASPQVVLGAAASPGEFTLRWEQPQGLRTDVKASHYRPGRGWRAAENDCAAPLKSMGTDGARPAGRAVRASAAGAGSLDSCY